MKVDTHFISQNIAPVGAKRIVVYDENGNRCGVGPLGRLTPPDRRKRLYSFGAISDDHVGEKPYDPENKLTPSYDNFVAALKCLQADDDVKFVIDGGDLIMWVTDENAAQRGREKLQLQEECFAKHSELVNEHLPGKRIYACSGNHELMYLRRTTEVDGESGQDWYIGRWMNDYAGWSNDPENGAIDLVKTVYLNSKGEPDPNGNDVLVLMSCYMYQASRLAHEYSKAGLVFENIDGTTTITVSEKDFDWNEEWLGETAVAEGETIVGFTLHLGSAENSFGVFVVGGVEGNILTLRGTIDLSHMTDGVCTDEVKIWSEFVPQSQLYPARDLAGRPKVRYGKYGEIEELFANLKEQGKRIFVVQHVPVTSDYPEYGSDPANSYWLYKSLFYGATVFSGHTHYQFDYPSPTNPRHSLNTSAGFRSVHIPSVYNHAQGYIVDVYEDGIHLRGKTFREMNNGELICEDVPLGTYWIET